MGAFSFTKNAAKSLGFAAAGAIKTQMFGQTAELIEEVFSSGDSVKEVASEVTSLIKENVVKDVGAAMVKNTTEAVRTGKFYRSEEEKGAAMASALGFDDDMMSDFDTSDMVGRGDDGGDSDIDMGDFGGDSSTPVQVSDNRVTNVSNKFSISSEASSLGSKVGTAIGAAGTVQASAVIGSSRALGRGITATNTILDNIRSLIQEQKHAVIAGYNHQTGLDSHRSSLMTGISEMAVQLQEINRASQAHLGALGLTVDGRASDGIETKYDKIFTEYGGFSPENYVRTVSDRIKTTLEDMNMFKDMLTNPLELAMDSLAEKFFPESLQKSFQRMDNIIGGLPATLMLQLEEWANITDDGVLNTLKRGAGRFLGMDRDDTRVDARLGTLDKAVPFDAHTKKAITEVIPKYLSLILNAINGGTEGDEQIFDYGTGKMRTRTEVVDQLNVERSAATRGVGFTTDMSRNVLDSFKFNPEQRKVAEKELEKIRSAEMAASGKSVGDLSAPGLNVELVDAWNKSVKGLGVSGLTQLQKEKLAFRASGAEFGDKVGSDIKGSAFRQVMSDSSMVSSREIEAQRRLDDIRRQTGEDKFRKRQAKGGLDKDEKKIVRESRDLEQEISSIRSSRDIQAYEVGGSVSSAQAVGRVKPVPFDADVRSAIIHTIPGLLRDIVRANGGEPTIRDKNGRAMRIDVSAAAREGRINRASEASIAALPEPPPDPLLSFFQDQKADMEKAKEIQAKLETGEIRKTKSGEIDKRFKDGKDAQEVLDRVTSVNKAAEAIGPNEEYTEQEDRREADRMSIKEMLLHPIQAIADMTDRVGDQVGRWFFGKPDAPEGGSLMDRMTKPVRIAFDWIKNKWTGMVDGIKSWWSQDGGGADAVIGAFKPITDFWSKKGGLKDSLQTQVWDPIKGFAQRSFEGVSKGLSELWSGDKEGGGIKAWMKDKVLDPVSNFASRALKQTGTALTNVRESLFGKEGALNKFWKKAQPHMGKVAATFGGGASLGIIGGPIGMIVGAGAGYALTTDKVKNWLFGKEGDDGDPGIIKKAGDWVQGNAKMLGGGTAGYMFGGPVGMIVGAGAGYALQTDKVQNWLFGNPDEEGDPGVIGKAKIWMKDHEGELWGAGLGGIGASLAGFGPVGMIIGAGAGYALGSQKVQDYLFGEEGKITAIYTKATDYLFGNEKTGDGGLFGEGGKFDALNVWVGENIIDPARTFFTETWTATADWTRKNVIDPMKGVFDPFMEEMKAGFNSLTDIVKNGIKEGMSAVSEFMGTMFETSFGKPFGEMIKENFLEPFGAHIKSFRDWLGKGLGGIMKRGVSFLQEKAAALREKQAARKGAAARAATSLKPEGTETQTAWQKHMGVGGTSTEKAAPKLTETRTEEAQSEWQKRMGVPDKLAGKVTSKDGTVNEPTAEVTATESAKPPPIPTEKQDTSTTSTVEKTGIDSQSKERASIAAARITERDAAARDRRTSRVDRDERRRTSRATRDADLDIKLKEKADARQARKEASLKASPAAQAPALASATSASASGTTASPAQGFGSMVETERHTKDMLNFMKDHLSGTGKNLARLVKKLGIDKDEVDESALGKHRGFFGRMFDKLTSPFKDIGRKLKDGIQAVLDAPKRLMNKIKDIVTDSFSWIKDRAQDIWEGVKAIATEVWDVTKTVTGEAWKAVQTVVPELWKGVTAITKTLWKGAEIAAKGLWDAGVSVTKTMWSAAQAIVPELWNGVKAVTTGLWGALKDDVIPALWSGVTKVVNGLWDGVKALGRGIGSIFGIGADAVSGLASGGKVQLVKIIGSVAIPMYGVEGPGLGDLSEDEVSAGSSGPGVLGRIGGFIGRAVRGTASAISEGASAVFGGSASMTNPSPRETSTPTKAEATSVQQVEIVRSVTLVTRTADTERAADEKDETMDQKAESSERKAIAEEADRDRDSTRMDAKLKDRKAARAARVAKRRDKVKEERDVTDSGDLADTAAIGGMTAADDDADDDVLDTVGVPAQRKGGRIRNIGRKGKAVWRAGRSIMKYGAKRAGERALLKMFGKGGIKTMGKGLTKVGGGAALSAILAGVELARGGFTGHRGSEEAGVGEVEGMISGMLTGSAKKRGTLAKVFRTKEGGVGEAAAGMVGSTGRGAMIGATLGSIIPGAGTAAGAAVGAGIGGIMQARKLVMAPDESVIKANTLVLALKERGVVRDPFGPGKYKVMDWDSVAMMPPANLMELTRSNLFSGRTKDKFKDIAKKRGFGEFVKEEEREQAILDEEESIGKKLAKAVFSPIAGLKLAWMAGKSIMSIVPSIGKWLFRGKETREADALAKALTTEGVVKDPLGWGKWKVTDWDAIGNLPGDKLDLLSKSSKFGKATKEKMAAIAKSKGTVEKEEEDKSKEAIKADKDAKDKESDDFKAIRIVGSAAIPTYGISELYGWLTGSKSEEEGDALAVGLEKVGVLKNTFGWGKWKVLDWDAIGKLPPDKLRLLQQSSKISSYSKRRIDLIAKAAGKTIDKEEREDDKTGIDKIKDKASAALTKSKEAVGKAWDMTKQKSAAAGAFIKGFGKGLLDSGKNLVSNIAKAPGEILGAFKDWGKAIWNMGKDFVANIKEKFFGFMGKIKDFFIKIPGMLKDAIKNAIKGIWNKLFGKEEGGEEDTAAFNESVARLKGSGPKSDEQATGASESVAKPETRGLSENGVKRRVSKTFIINGVSVDEETFRKHKAEKDAKWNKMQSGFGKMGMPESPEEASEIEPVMDKTPGMIKPDMLLGSSKLSTSGGPIPKRSPTATPVSVVKMPTTANRPTVEMSPREMFSRKEDIKTKMLASSIVGDQSKMLTLLEAIASNTNRTADNIESGIPVNLKVTSSEAGSEKRSTDSSMSSGPNMFVGGQGPGQSDAEGRDKTANASLAVPGTILRIAKG